MAANVKIEIEAVHKGFRGAQRAMDGLSTGVQDLGRNIKAMLGLEIAEYLLSAAGAAREFAMAGVDASRVAKQFTGDLGGLRAASGNAVDDTTLQRLDIAARKLNLWGHEVEAFTRLSTKLAREGGKEMADVFQQLIDASPEQLEKWGVLTSDLVEELRGLDTVQQKQALRQALVNEGMKITNEEIQAQTSNVEKLSTRWDNWVSDVQAGTAAIAESDGFNHALETMGSSFDSIGTAIGDATDKLGGFLSELGKPVGLGDVGVAELFDLFWYSTVIGPIKLASDAYNYLEQQLTSGTVVRGARDAAKAVLLAEEAARNRAEGAKAVAELEALMASQETQGTASPRNTVAAERADTYFAETTPGFDFTLPGALDDKTPGPRRRRGPSEFDKAIADARAAWFQFRQDRAQAVGEAALEERQRIEEAGLAMFNTLGNGLVDMVATAGSELGVGSWESGIFSTILFGEDPETQLEMMQRFTGELENLSSTWGSFTQGMGAGADQIRGAIDALSTITAATPELEKANTNLGKGFDKTTQAIGTYASTGIGALSAFTGAFIEDQKTQAGIMAAFEAAQALASWPDPIGIATHTAAAALFGAIAAGAFDGGGGGAARGGAQAGAAFGAPTLADAFDGGGDRETEETTVIQLQVDGRAIGEASLRGANNSASTFRRGERLQANAVGIGRKELF